MFGPTFYTGATLFDPASGQRLRQSVVAVEEGKIVAVGRRADFPEVLPGREFRLDGRYLLPGLFNCHAHLALDGDDTPYSTKLPLLKAEPEHIRIAGYLEQARRNLSYGVTSVRDLHPGPAGAIDGLHFTRYATDVGLFPGCRLFLADRPLVVAAGHGTHWLSRVVSGVDEVVRAVRETVQEGADCIKLMAAHAWGPLPDRPETWGAYFTREELVAAVETAHSLGVPVAAHCHGESVLRAVIESGVDSVEHGSGLTEELAKLMAKRGTYLVPTLASYENIVMRGLEGGLSEDRVREAGWVRKRQRDGFRLALEAGVRIAAGSDAGFHMLPHGVSLHDELRLYQELGMEPRWVLASATSDAAKLVGVWDRLGSVDVGKCADFIVCSSDPSEDVKNLASIEEVVLGGERHDVGPLRGQATKAEASLGSGRRTYVQSELQNRVE